MEDFELCLRMLWVATMQGILTPGHCDLIQPLHSALCFKCSLLGGNSFCIYWWIIDSAAETLELGEGHVNGSFDLFLAHPHGILQYDWSLPSIYTYNPHSPCILYHGDKCGEMCAFYNSNQSISSFNWLYLSWLFILSDSPFWCDFSCIYEVNQNSSEVMLPRQFSVSDRLNVWLNMSFIFQPLLHQKHGSFLDQLSCFQHSTERNNRSWISLRCWSLLPVVPEQVYYLSDMADRTSVQKSLY